MKIFGQQQKMPNSWNSLKFWLINQNQKMSTKYPCVLDYLSIWWRFARKYLMIFWMVSGWLFNNYPKNKISQKPLMADYRIFFSVCDCNMSFKPKLFILRRFTSFNYIKSMYSISSKLTKKYSYIWHFTKK